MSQKKVFQSSGWAGSKSCQSGNRWSATGSDADNVAYDSDHFKGTLVDKTFTDEDMRAADHYMLTNGSNFVWVKDAITSKLVWYSLNHDFRHILYSNRS